MKLQIDWTRCDGHGLCAALLEGHIGRDEWGFPVLPDSATHIDPRLLSEAVRACPAMALRLEAPARSAAR
jgi:ferredoxin